MTNEGIVLYYCIAIIIKINFLNTTSSIVEILHCKINNSELHIFLFASQAILGCLFNEIQ